MHPSEVSLTTKLDFLCLIRTRNTEVVKRFPPTVVLYHSWPRIQDPFDVHRVSQRCIILPATSWYIRTEGILCPHGG